MQKELIKFIIENNLNPFSVQDKNLKNSEENIFKTKDARAIHNKVISSISKNFIFRDTNSILDAFYFTDNIHEIKKRQEFFSNISRDMNNKFLSEIKIPSPSWSPRYDIVAVTANEKTFIQLKELGCPVKFITAPEDVLELENCDIIQAVDCEDFDSYLEQLNQSIFINNIDDVYLERYLELLSGWKKNLEILDQYLFDTTENKNFLSPKNPTDKKEGFRDEMKDIVFQLRNLLNLVNEGKAEKITFEKAEEAIETINTRVSERIKTISISGSQLFEMLSKNSLSKEILEIIDEEINKTGISEDIFNKSMPVTINEQELNKLVKQQDSNEFISLSEKIKKRSNDLKEVPEKLKKLETLILLFDFYSGVSKFIKEEYKLAQDSEEFLMEDSSNIFLENAQPISFLLDTKHRCSILTGANSGGKTTLLEHIIQLISLFQIGLPVSGSVHMPVFSEIYYFAKNKGSISKGAFETLLMQMSKISPGKQTLILADEIESVTEPGVAGKVLCATADYFIKKGCFLVIATHLGHEIQKNLPNLARIDGIEAKGLDENYELIVSHNPILGRLAHSTPELIIEKMAKSKENEYINWVFEWVKKGN